jgi:hypothetical protein
VQARRAVLQQEFQGGVHRLGTDEVVVVQDQQHLAPVGLGGQLVDQRRHQPFKRRRGRWVEHRGDLVGEPRPYPVQRGGDMAPEPCRVVVTLVQRQPGDRPPAGLDPMGQQAGLAEPGRRADQQQPPRQPVVKLLQQAWARHEAGLRAGQVQLGGQQPVRSAGIGVGRGRSGRFGHRALPRRRKAPGWDTGGRAHCRRWPQGAEPSAPAYAAASPSRIQGCRVEGACGCHPDATFGYRAAWPGAQKFTPNGTSG